MHRCYLFLAFFFVNIFCAENSARFERAIAILESVQCDRRLFVFCRGSEQEDLIRETSERLQREIRWLPADEISIYELYLERRIHTLEQRAYHLRFIRTGCFGIAMFLERFNVFSTITLIPILLAGCSTATVEEAINYFDNTAAFLQRMKFLLGLQPSSEAMQ